MFDRRPGSSPHPNDPLQRRPDTPPQGLRWKLNRLRCMTPAELPHRAWRALAARIEAMGLHGSTDVMPAPDLSRTAPAWIHADAQVDALGYLVAADRIVAGRFDVFALRDVSLGSPPRWNRDPKTCVEVPLRFGKLLDHRDPQRVGDIKYLWEPNRHLHLVTLAQAWALSRGERYFRVIREHLESWFEACPCPLGPNWISSLEVAMRLINWSVVWQLLGGPRSPLFESAECARFRDRWLLSVYQHAQFIRHNFSLYSSANNHLVGEAAGLFLAALTWPLWPAAQGWRARAAAILEREALLQNHADGVNREQAVSYQQFELDLLLLPLLAARAGQSRFSAAFEARVAAMIEYLASIMDVGGNVPMFGDADDGAVLNLVPQRDFCRYRSLIACGALLFGRGDFKAKAGPLDDKARWLFGAGADAAYAQLDDASPRLPIRRAFPDGGYYILGCDFETPKEVRLIVDAGPLGYRKLAAHGHADALAFTLSLGGHEFLIDPGTYAYHSHPRWRSYFRGTAAHNTLRVDGEDQSLPGGNFMWLSRATACCTMWRSNSELDLFEGWHDGYLRLGDPVVHRRRIALHKCERVVVIDDTLLMAGTHEVELFFHFGELCQVHVRPDGCVLTQGERSVHLKLPLAAGSSAQLDCGSLAPIRGWISRHYDDKQASSTIVWRGRATGHTKLRTQLLW